MEFKHKTTDMNHLQSEKKDIRRVSKQISLLMAAEHDLRMNVDDSNFVKEQMGTFLYFLDADVVSCYVAPSDEQSHGDYGALVGKSEIRSAVMMIATSYIFSPRLVGRFNNPLYITEWHRKETLSRFNKIHQNAMTLIASENANILSTFDEINAICKRSPLTGNDFLSLCRLISNEAVYYPLHLIERILESPVLESPISRFDVSEHDYKKSYTAYKIWQKSLKKFRPLREDEDRSGYNARIASDAKSLAFLQWLSDNLAKESERIVLVTASKSLINCYRDWYFSPNGGESLGKKYIVRSVAQYLPQINLKDSSRDIQVAGIRGGKRIYENIRNIVSGVVNRHHVDRLSKDISNDSKSLFFLENSQATESDCAPEPSSDFLDLIDRTCNELYEIEQYSIYLYENYIRDRIGSAKDKKLISDSIEKRHLDLLTRVAKIGAENIMPALVKSLGSIERRSISRIPSNLNLIVSKIKLSDAVNRLATKHVRVSEFSEIDYAEMFAIYAGIFLGAYHNGWALDLSRQNAETSLLCLKLPTKRQQEDCVNSLCETHFLCFVITRFQLGASQNITSSEIHYFAALQHMAAIESQSSFYESNIFRIKSEQAALILFYALQVWRYDKNKKMRLLNYYQCRKS